MKLKEIKRIDILNNSKIKIYIVESSIDLYNEIARVMVDTIKENNNKGIMTSFILPVGPRGQYKRFVRICNIEKVSCKNLITINMDEYLDKDDNYLPESHPLSFRGFMKKNLFDLLDDDLKIKPENIFFPDPDNTLQIEKVINEIGGADICFGGVGINGHIAFNEPIYEKYMEPEEYIKLKTRVLDVSEDTLTMNCLSYGGYKEFMPRRCVTVGMEEIFKSKELKFYLEHDWQSSVLRKIIFEKPTPSFPATFLKEHENSSITISRNVIRRYVC
jgi:glucosamine-6-phosphate deaminase